MGELFLVGSQLDSKMVVSGTQIPSELETQGAAERPLQPSHRSYFCTRDSTPGPISRPPPAAASLTPTVHNHLSKQS